MGFIFSNASFLELMFWGFLAIALIYLIAKRIEDKENETFEDRDF